VSPRGQATIYIQCSVCVTTGTGRYLHTMPCKCHHGDRPQFTGQCKCQYGDKPLYRCMAVYNYGVSHLYIQLCYYGDRPYLHTLQCIKMGTGRCIRTVTDDYLRTKQHHRKRQTGIYMHTLCKNSTAVYHHEDRPLYTCMAVSPHDRCLYTQQCICHRGDRPLFIQSRVTVATGWCLYAYNSVNVIQ